MKYFELEAYPKKGCCWVSKVEGFNKTEAISKFRNSSNKWTNGLPIKKLIVKEISKEKFEEKL